MIGKTNGISYSVYSVEFYFSVNLFGQYTYKLQSQRFRVFKINICINTGSVISDLKQHLFAFLFESNFKGSLSFSGKSMTDGVIDHLVNNKPTGNCLINVKSNFFSFYD